MNTRSERQEKEYSVGRLTSHRNRTRGHVNGQEVQQIYMASICCFASYKAGGTEETLAWTHQLFCYRSGNRDCRRQLYVESSQCYTRNTQKRICHTKLKNCSGVQACKDESTSL